MSVPFNPLTYNHNSDEYAQFQYGRGDAYGSYARLMAFLRGHGARVPATPLLSDQLAQAARDIDEQRRIEAAATGTGSDKLLHGVLGLLLLLAVLQSLWLLARGLYALRLSRLATHMKGHHTPVLSPWMVRLAFLAPTPLPVAPAATAAAIGSAASSSSIPPSASQSRAPVLFGVLLGCTSLLLVQWLLSPTTVATMWGVQGYGASSSSPLPSAPLLPPNSGIHNLAATAVSCPLCPVPASTAAASCPACNCPAVAVYTPPPPLPPCPSATAAAAPIVAAAAEGSCSRISDPPPGMEPLFAQSSYSPLPLVRDFPCAAELANGGASGGGKWVVRPGFDENDPDTWPKWTKVDQWGLFGAEPSPLHFKYIWEPPASCAVDGRGSKRKAWRRFDADKFLRALQGRTLSFLGDSLVRQQFGFLLALLHEHVLGTSYFYSPSARQLDPIREVSLRYNVTLKNQWLMGHNNPPHTLLAETYPTLWRSDALLLNVGAFFRDDKAADFSDTLLAFLDWAAKKANYPGQLLWREYSPTHFDTDDGEYDMGQRQDGQLPECRAATEKSMALSADTNYRVTLANGLMRARGVPVLPVFNATLLIPDAAAQHPGKGDCRHWFSKSSALEHWADVLYNALVPLAIE